MEEINIPVTTDVLLRACLRGGGGPQVGEVTPLRWGNPPVHIMSHICLIAFT